MTGIDLLNIADILRNHANGKPAQSPAFATRAAQLADQLTAAAYKLWHVDGDISITDAFTPADVADLEDAATTLNAALDWEEGGCQSAALLSLSERIEGFTDE